MFRYSQLEDIRTPEKRYSITEIEKAANVGGIMTPPRTWSLPYPSKPSHLKTSSPLSNSKRPYFPSHLNIPPITKTQIFVIMAGKKNMGENGKKVSGNAQKAEAAAAKAAAAQQAQSQVEADDWGRGAKNSSKK